ncbi:3-hexulose-6-phosphate synthase [Halobacillus karajensis]|uniref:3-hexulose-6-phosphate synthase n=1 Tax=Halobacillus karajensis TaxID=195088 RepID=A0A059NZ88_9BACI|nr:3-hexulose-6-phosphate synthase [Halobacillus karajensis]CDQ18521.1 3-hexulose-6-phosphate synthase [Halobacillus karajensis]CDQ23407.1 3-hexulose-6-phosphate synthase [Halobacillus karajensis]CDQ26889.1 3-hexulose-6-phosphate synthase [Halobacillus karajensis]SEH50429.1 3-hexulose-6-phosphate synthase [Halobacillus karajensis]
MKLQLALDRMPKGDCFQVIEDTKESIDWIEVGTGVIKEYGMEIVRDIKKAFPQKTLVADMKTCDAGKHEASQAFEAGADITTVMAFSANQTIKDSLKVAEDCHGRIMIDLLGVKEEARIRELSDIGVDLVSLHFGKDMQEAGDLQEDDLFSLVHHHPYLDVAVAGGINLDSLSSILNHQPNTLIVGSGITKSTDRQGTAAKMKERMKNHEANNSNRQR